MVGCSRDREARRGESKNCGQAPRKNGTIVHDHWDQDGDGSLVVSETGRTNVASVQGGAVEPRKMIDIGGKVSFTYEDDDVAGFEKSTNLVLGDYLRKIYWKNDVMKA